MGVGTLMPFWKIKSLAGIILAYQKKLVLVALVPLSIYTAAVTYRMVFMDFILEGWPSNWAVGNSSYLFL